MVIPLRDNAPSYETPYATLSFILLNLGVFMLELVWPGGIEAFIATWGEVPARIWAGEMIPGTTLPAWIGLFTNMFVHFNTCHLLGNMLVLWLFGDNIEWVCGRPRFVVFYLGSGLASSLITTTIGAQSTEASAGASGAIAGVMAAYLIFYPRARITSLLWVSPYGFWHMATGSWGFVTRNISALWYVGSWLLFEVLCGGAALSMKMYGNYGVYAHVAGAAAGALLIWPLHYPRRRPNAEHDTQSGELTAMIIGDEGDGGSGAENLTPEEELLRWQHTPQGRLQQRIEELRTPFSDRFAQDMLERGDYAGALEHCEQMLELARRERNEPRTAGYADLVRRASEQLAARPPQRLPVRNFGAASAPRTTAPPVLPLTTDPFNLGQVPRGTRRRS